MVLLIYTVSYGYFNINKYRKEKKMVLESGRRGDIHTDQEPHRLLKQNKTHEQKSEQWSSLESILTEPLSDEVWGKRYPRSRGFLAGSHQWLRKLSVVTDHRGAFSPRAWVCGFPGLSSSLLPPPTVPHLSCTPHCRHVISLFWLYYFMKEPWDTSCLQIREILVFLLNLTFHRSDSYSSLTFFLF